MWPWCLFLGIFTFYKHQDPPITWHRYKGRREHVYALTSVDTMAADIHSSEHETERLIFYVFVQFHAHPGVRWCDVKCVPSMVVCIAVNNFSVLKKVEFHDLSG